MNRRRREDTLPVRKPLQNNMNRPETVYIPPYRRCVKTTINSATGNVIRFNADVYPFI